MVEWPQTAPRWRHPGVVTLSVAKGLSCGLGVTAAMNGVMVQTVPSCRSSA